MATLRGADLVAQTLRSAGVEHLFSLSGNHIMPLYDAALDAKLRITHTRHEGAAVHMADAWGRLTGEPGIAVLTGGPGHANGIGALYTALASESPMVLLSGHAPLRELGRGSFQEMRQADMAEPVVKASWTAATAEGLSDDILKAMRLAITGRPGPVHLSLPFDLLEANVQATVPASAGEYRTAPQPLTDADAQKVLDLIDGAEHPLVLVGPVMSPGRGDAVRRRLAAQLGVPVLCMESPRGLNDPALGALASVVKRADLVVLLGKEPDFTLRFAEAPALGESARLVIIDPEAAALERALKVIGRQRLAWSGQGDSVATAERLTALARSTGNKRAWNDEVDAAINQRPDDWASIDGSAEPIHPVTLGRAVDDFLGGAKAPLLVADGGEFGQWSQACVSAPSRLINGQGGSIGSAIPFALAARVARPDATIVAMSGDGAAGFHLLEIETAVRSGLPFVAVIGNDACWNAEHQIQLRTYGAARAHSCELAPTRYDQVAEALGGYGELVTRAADLPAALRRAADSGKPAVLNVMIQRLPAPTVGAARPAH